MNYRLPFTFAFACLSSLSIAHAQTATTDPVGVMEFTVKGHGGNGSSALTFMSVPFIHDIEYSGAIDSVSANTIIDNDASWSDDQFNDLYFIRITSGSNEGMSATITDTSANQISTFEDLSTFASNGDTFTIRKYTTIGDVFGDNNESGLLAGASAGDADTILIQDVENQSFFTYYFKNAGIGGTGWRSTTNGVDDQADTIIYPGSSFVIKRKVASDITLTVNGSVQTDNTTLPIEQNINFIASHYPTKPTLNKLFGSDGGPLDGGASTVDADSVLVPNGSGGFITYYYKNSGIGGIGWRTTTNGLSQQGDTILTDVGGSVIVNRSQGGALNLTETAPF